MDAERARAFLLTLPHVVETMQWGDNLVYWTGDKAIGGKMFALVDLEGGLAHGMAMFCAGPERFSELVEREDILPARYLARAHWVAARTWSALRPAEWEQELRNAHEMVLNKLPRRTRDVLALPEREQKKLIAEGRKKAAELQAREQVRKAEKRTTQKKQKTRS